MVSLSENIGFWAHQLGLLPVAALPNELARFVMLNGSRGNFCLDFREQTVPNDEAKGVAWSANVGHYVTASKEQVQVHRWDRPIASSETYPTSSIAENLEKFHQYLETTEPSVEHSVITHVLRTFRKLRATVPQLDGRSALLAFLELLATAIDQHDSVKMKPDSWALPDSSAKLSGEVPPKDWQILLAELLEPTFTSGLSFNPNLTLRHAAGQIFQEAHYEATVAMPNQLGLGFDIRPAKIGNRADAIGIHFTPPSLARTLVEQALLMSSELGPAINIFDPACGSGEFLRELIRQIRMRGYEGVIRISGFDLSPIACDMARFVLAWEKRQDKFHIEVDIKCCDSLGQDCTWPNNVDLLLMNPPFVSYENLSKEQKEAVERTLGSLAKGRVDLSMAFVWKAATHLKKNAILGAIIPASLLESESSLGLRQALSSYVLPPSRRSAG